MYTVSTYSSTLLNFQKAWHSRDFFFFSAFSPEMSGRGYTLNRWRFVYFYRWIISALPMVFSIVCPGLLLSFQFSEYDRLLFCYHFLVKNRVFSFFFTYLPNTQSTNSKALQPPILISTCPISVTSNGAKKFRAQFRGVDWVRRHHWPKPVLHCGWYGMSPAWRSRVSESPF